MKRHLFNGITNPEFKIQSSSVDSTPELKKTQTIDLFQKHSLRAFRYRKYIHDAVPHSI